MSRLYKKTHESKLKPAEQAAADYANGEYKNEYPSELERKEYHQVHFDLTQAEPLEQTA